MVPGGAETGQDQRGVNLEQRSQYEGTLMHAWVGQGQLAVVEHRVAMEQQIEIEGARGVGNASHTAMTCFNRQKLVQQRKGRELGVDGDHSIDKVRLVEEPDGRASVKGGAGGHTGAG